MSEFGDTVDRNDIDRFAAQSAAWWDPEGSFRPLHRINPARLDFIRRQLLASFGRDAKGLRPFEGLRLIDIGCGGGLVAEPMTRLGFAVTGIDAGAATIDVARAHASASGLAIDYRVADAETLARAGERFDVALALEVVEHVANRDAFFAALGALVRPGGAFIGATLNRTARSFALAIVGAEYLLGGVDVAIECTGGGGLDAALRLVRAGGKVVLSGMPSSVDLTPLWYRELTLIGAYASDSGGGHGSSDFADALSLAGHAPLDGYVDATYPLSGWREAIGHALAAGRLGSVKVAFDPTRD